jgi:hypothetical protein
VLAHFRYNFPAACRSPGVIVKVFGLQGYGPDISGPATFCRQPAAKRHFLAIAGQTLKLKDIVAFPLLLIATAKARDHFV